MPGFFRGGTSPPVPMRLIHAANAPGPRALSRNRAEWLASSMSLLQGGHVAVVTGAESGIGAACAKALGAAGAAVGVLYYKDADAAEHTVQAIAAAGSKAFAIAADVCSEAAVEAAFDATRSRLGMPDILVNSAGLNQSGIPVVDMPLSQWERLLRTDLTGAFLTCRRFVRDLRAASRPGRVIN